MAQPYSYAMVVERKSAGESSAQPSECGGSEQCRDEDVECVQFSAGNPRVEHITGLVHLYRRQVSVPVDPQSPSSSSSALAAQDPEHGLTLCCLAIPADMSVAAFCTFCGAYLDDIKRLQVLRREGAPNSVCMVLMTFSCQAKADSFYADFNGNFFSSLEPEILCRLVYVRSVEVVGDQQGALLDPPPGHGELPTCPVCLERLDEHISGVVVTVCNHQFHGECLKKWGDTSCPVCRFCMFSSAATTSRCSTCGSGSNLWICLICGHVGCGRYKSGHAHNHWQASQHCYALELETQRVWDYAGDGYVHRLIQSKTDGKLVEVPSPAPACGHASPAQRRAACSGTRRSVRGLGLSARSGSGGSGLGTNGRGSDAAEEEDAPCGHCPECRAEADVKEAMMASKLDAISYEYNHLLASQLDSQRQYWEGLLAQQRLEADARVASALAASEHSGVASAAAVAEAREAERRRQALERKLADATAAAAKLKEEKEFLRSLNETLLSNQRELKEQLAATAAASAAKDASIQDLQEQVRDLMVFIEAQRTIVGSGGELDNATLLPVPEGQQNGGGKGRRRSKK